MEFVSPQIGGHRVPGRVGAGVVWMMGGGACAALGGAAPAMPLAVIVMVGGVGTLAPLSEELSLPIID